MSVPPPSAAAAVALCMLPFLLCGACTAPRAASPIGELRLVGDAPEWRDRDAVLPSAGVVTAGDAVFRGDAEQRAGELLLASGPCALHRAAADEPESTVVTLEIHRVPPTLPDRIDTASERVVVEPEWLHPALRRRDDRVGSAAASPSGGRPVRATLLLASAPGAAAAATHVLTCAIPASGHAQIDAPLMARMFTLGLRPLGCGHEACAVTQRTSLRGDGTSAMHELRVEIPARDPTEVATTWAERRHRAGPDAAWWTEHPGVQQQHGDPRVYMSRLRTIADGPLAQR